MAAAAVGTWAFSLPAVQKLRSLLKNGVGATDSLQEVIADIEDSEETGQYIIGRGGYPNKNGQVQCDAAIMEGFPGRFGAVAALHGIGTPIVVARKVMDKSIHSLLVGEGALAFAREEGFMEEENECMLSQQSAEAYREYLGKKTNYHGHDTLGLIALDIYGNITVATGEGDKIMCFCPCFHVVLLMKQGLSPNDACESVIKEIINRVGDEDMFELGIIAMNIKGETGAASSVQFTYCSWTQEKDCVEQLIRSPCQQ
ncbi:N(4)-(Beta-N-acetylglucosaminyl)-L-asparaginase-like isoform X2 [Monodelphis domestica]|uniref:N(4)-(Beta-N-acetylglucosaminyl)-L-asparaginase- like isoform X2 n=1 Tax=Monodelphis domestica TaxID=13616 RepID=UPI00044319B1|nr:N(4)-(Beta-N-acetylglucosaminyl)-L-asparaginase-like isoform X2 [Monodelphis domestica]